MLFIAAKELFGYIKKETMTYIDDDIHYKVVYEYSVNTKEFVLFYEEIELTTAHNFKTRQRIIIYESEKN